MTVIIEMKDRLQHFHEIASFGHDELCDSDHEYDEYLADANMRPLETSTDIFLEKSYDLQTAMKQVHLLIADLQKKQNEILTSVDINDVKNSERDAILDSIKNDTHNIHKELKSLEKEIESDKQSGTFSPIEIKMKTDQHNTLLLMFQETMSKYNEVQMMHRSKCHNR